MRQVVRDLRTLRELVAYLLRYDAVTFLAFLEVGEAEASAKAEADVNVVVWA